MLIVQTENHRDNYTEILFPFTTALNELRTRTCEPNCNDKYSFTVRHVEYVLAIPATARNLTLFRVVLIFLYLQKCKARETSHCAYMHRRTYT